MPRHTQPALLAILAEPHAEAPHARERAAALPPRRGPLRGRGHLGVHAVGGVGGHTKTLELGLGLGGGGVGYVFVLGDGGWHAEDAVLGALAAVGEACGLGGGVGEHAEEAVGRGHGHGAWEGGAGVGHGGGGLEGGVDGRGDAVGDVRGVLGGVAAEEVEVELCGAEVCDKGRVRGLRGDGVRVVFVHVHGVVDGVVGWQEDVGVLRKGGRRVCFAVLGAGGRHGVQAGDDVWRRGFGEVAGKGVCGVGMFLGPRGACLDVARS